MKSFLIDVLTVGCYWAFSEWFCKHYGVEGNWAVVILLIAFLFINIAGYAEGINKGKAFFDKAIKRLSHPQS